MNPTPQSNPAAAPRVREVGLRDGLQSIATCVPTAASSNGSATPTRRPARDRGRLLRAGAPAAATGRHRRSAGLRQDPARPARLGAGAQPEGRRARHRVRMPTCWCRCRPATRTAWPTCARRPTRWWPRSPHPRRARRRGLAARCIEVGISTAFGCTIQGRVEPDEVLRLVQALLDAGADRVSLADTVGYADPGDGRRLFERVLRSPATASGAATSTTRAAWRWPTSTRRCSWASRASTPPGRHRRLPARARRQRQRATEDLAYMLASMGMETGLDFDALLALRAKVAGWLEGETLHGTCGAPACPRRCAPGREAGAA
jgi:hydroxymethylglutaryl-CoA lyase